MPSDNEASQYSVSSPPPPAPLRVRYEMGPGKGQQTGQHTFNWLEIIRKLRLGDILSLEPIRQGQLPAGLENLERVLKEERLVGEMAQRLADPHGVERSALSSEKITHLFGVELDEADPAAAERDEAIGVGFNFFCLVGCF